MTKWGILHVSLSRREAASNCAISALKFLQAFTYKPTLKWVAIVRYNSAKMFTLKSKCYPWCDSEYHCVST